MKPSQKLLESMFEAPDRNYNFRFAAESTKTIRTHLALDKRTPAGRLLAKNGGGHCRILSTPKLGGLHHRYYGLAA